MNPNINSRRFHKGLVLCALCAAASALGGSSRAADLSAGFFAHDFRLTLDSGSRREILGPLFSFETNGTRWEQRWTPLFSKTVDPDTDFEEMDIGYPLLTYDRFGSQYRFQILQLFSFAGGESQDQVNTRRFTLFPLYFQQRSTDTNLNYTAVIPFYGHLKNRLFRDEIKFTLMPLYVQSRKKDVVTDNYVYPFFHLRHGDGLKGWQFWPLVGREHKDITTRTDRFGDPEKVPGHDKFFVLWPFYFNNHLDIGSDNPQEQRILLPFHTVLRSPKRDSVSYFWPLFSHTEEREKKYTEWGAPWPLVVFTRGEGKSGDRVWPLFSKFHSPTAESSFYLWPVYKHNHAVAPPLDRDRTRILFFLYSDLIEKHTGTGEVRRRRDLWPLFTRRQDLNGNERLQILAPVEPILPGSKSIDRDYAPVWSLWRSEHNAKTGAASQSLLWNLYRRDTTATTRKCSLFFGLYQYESTPEGKHSRWFYWPIKRSPQSAANGAGAEEKHRQP